MGPGRSLSQRCKIGTSAAEATTYKDSPGTSQAARFDETEPAATNSKSEVSYARLKSRRPLQIRTQRQRRPAKAGCDTSIPRGGISGCIAQQGDSQSQKPRLRVFPRNLLASGVGWDAIQNFADFGGQRFQVERLLQEGHAALQHAVTEDAVVGVAGDVQNFEIGTSGGEPCG
jgi:hypothetical protein